MTEGYKIKPLTAQLYEELIKPCNYPGHLLNVFGGGDPLKMLNELELGGWRADWFLILREIEGTPQETVVAIVVMQWYCSDGHSLTPLVHWDVFPGHGRRAIDFVPNVVTSLCSHFRLRQVTGYQPSVTDAAWRMFEMVFKRYPESRQLIRFVERSENI